MPSTCSVEHSNGGEPFESCPSSPLPNRSPRFSRSRTGGVVLYPAASRDEPSPNYASVVERLTDRNARTSQAARVSPRSAKRKVRSRLKSGAGAHSWTQARYSCARRIGHPHRCYPCLPLSGGARKPLAKFLLSLAQQTGYPRRPTNSPRASSHPRLSVTRARSRRALQSAFFGRAQTA